MLKHLMSKVARWKDRGIGYIMTDVEEDSMGTDSHGKD